MATYNSVLVGIGNQSVDNVTMYSSRGQRLMRRKADKVTNPRTDKQRTQRAKMALLVTLAQGFEDVYKVGFPNRKAGQTACNRFVAANMENVSVDGSFAATMDYGHLACSEARGRRAPGITVTLTGSTYGLDVVPDTNYYGMAKPDDKVYGVMVETERMESALLELGSRGEGGTMSFPLPTGWSEDKVKAYTFATSADGKRTSATVAVEVTPGA